MHLSHCFYKSSKNPITQQLFALHGSSSISKGNSMSFTTTPKNATSGTPSSSTVYQAWCDCSIRVERATDYLLNTSIGRINQIVYSYASYLLILMSKLLLFSESNCSVTAKDNCSEKWYHYHEPLPLFLQKQHKSNYVAAISIARK